jgi:hypothetical protein
MQRSRLYDGTVSVVAMTSDSQSGNPGSIPGRSPANQADHPSEVDKLVAISRQWVTAVEYCGCKCTWPYDGRMKTMLPEAQTTSCGFLRLTCRLINDVSHYRTLNGHIYIDDRYIFQR